MRKGLAFIIMACMLLTAAACTKTGNEQSAQIDIKTEMKNTEPDLEEQVNLSEDNSAGTAEGSAAAAEIYIVRFNGAKYASSPLSVVTEENKKNIYEVLGVLDESNGKWSGRKALRCIVDDRPGIVVEGDSGQSYIFNFQGFDDIRPDVDDYMSLYGSDDITDASIIYQSKDIQLSKDEVNEFKNLFSKINYDDDKYFKIISTPAQDEPNDSGIVYNEDGSASTSGYEGTASQWLDEYATVNIKLDNGYSMSFTYYPKIEFALLYDGYMDCSTGLNDFISSIIK